VTDRQTPHDGKDHAMHNVASVKHKMFPPRVSIAPTEGFPSNFVTPLGFINYTDSWKARRHNITISLQQLG